MGEFTVELYWKHAPNTCRNFAELARRGYYNGIKFHRIITDFMIQGGDPTATGTELCQIRIMLQYNSVDIHSVVYRSKIREPPGTFSFFIFTLKFLVYTNFYCTKYNKYLA